MPIESPKLKKRVGTPIQTSAIDKRTNLLRTTLGAALIMAASGLAGCAQKPVDITPQNDEIKTKELTPAPSPSASHSASPSIPPFIPSGEETPKEPSNSRDFFKAIFETPGYWTMNTGGTWAGIHFPRGDMEIMINAATNAELPTENLTQVKCTIDKTEYTNYWEKFDNNWYVFLDCDLPQVKKCATLKEAIPYLTDEQKSKLTYTDRNTVEKPLPPESVFQIGQLRLNEKPGCEGLTIAATTPAPTPVPPTAPSGRRYHPTYNVPGKPGVSKAEFDQYVAAQAEKDQTQDDRLDTIDSETADMRERMRCFNPNKTMTPGCAALNQEISGQGSAPRNEK